MSVSGSCPQLFVKHYNYYPQESADRRAGLRNSLPWDRLCFLSGRNRFAIRWLAIIVSNPIALTDSNDDFWVPSIPRSNMRHAWGHHASIIDGSSIRLDDSRKLLQSVLCGYYSWYVYRSRLLYQIRVTSKCPTSTALFFHFLTSSELILFIAKIMAFKMVIKYILKDREILPKIKLKLQQTDLHPCRIIRRIILFSLGKS